MVHALATLCAVSGLILLAVFIFHAVERKYLHLVDRPGTIGVVGAMLASDYGATSANSRRASYSRSLTMSPPPGGPQVLTGSSILALLHPNDTNKEVQEKLKNKRFRLNRETGALEMEGDASDEMHQPPRDSKALSE